MKQSRTLILRKIVVVALILAAIPAARAETTILVIRHGEKPEEGFGQLSCQGLNRSLELPARLMARYGIPTRLFAPNPTILKNDMGHLYPYIRPLATIEPLAIRLRLPVDIRWGMAELDSVRDAILSEADGLQVVAWEHHLGENLAKRLLEAMHGDSHLVPNWQDDDFDSIFVIRGKRDASGQWRNATFSRERQELDGLSIECPGTR